ncbi:MAG: DUF5916 domain-containing protein [Flavobacteriaceae bacterium]
MRRAFCCVIVLLFSSFLLSQTPEKSFTVKFISETITTDGSLDEAVWQTASGPHDFQQYFPSDSILAKNQTDIKMVYDDTSLYIAMTVTSIGNDWVIPSLRRDFRASGNDNINLVFDTFNDGTTAFMFGINPYGVQREVLISGGGLDLSGFNTSWDVKWKGESKIYDGYYTAEIEIPLTSFKFKEGETKWRFQSYRFDMQSNERSVWYNVPQNQLVISLAFMGDMYFEKPLGKSRTPLAMIPYVNMISTKDFETDQGINNVKVGGDAKIAIGNGMNLDITLNPDFSNVEVDDIITNLTRFEISLPERRQFFVDNGDLFGSFGGSRDANPFFSRRIGIATDKNNNSIENGILGGVRLSGKLNENLRLGFLNLQTAEDLDNEIPSNNNMMLALQHKVFSRSNIGVFFLNKESFKDYDFIADEDAYNRVVGIDYNLSSKDNSWFGKFYGHKSFQPGDNEGNFSSGAFLGRNSRRFNFFQDLVYIDEEFRSDLGFVPRTDILKSATSAEYVFWPTSKFINQYSFEFFPTVTWRPGLDFQNTDRDIVTSLNFELKDQSMGSLSFTNSFIYLTESFDPTNTEGAVELPGSLGYNFNSVSAAYESNRANVFFFEGESSVGRFFNGNRFSFMGGFNLRLQPKAIISLALNYDKLTLPDPYPSADLWLLSPRVEITFSKSIFWTTIAQYSNQQNNLGLNSRLQWRFAPLSDLFIVYNDNYFVNTFSPRFRSINLKLSYWLNI